MHLRLKTTLEPHEWYGGKSMKGYMGKGMKGYKGKSVKG